MTIVPGQALPDVTLTDTGERTVSLLAAVHGEPTLIVLLRHLG